MPTPANLRYTIDSIRAIDAVKEQIGSILRRRATEKTLREGRELVTRDDVLACVAEAIREIRADSKLPSFKDLEGIDITEGVDPTEYVRRVRDDD